MRQIWNITRFTLAPAPSYPSSTSYTQIIQLALSLYLYQSTCSNPIKSSGNWLGTLPSPRYNHGVEFASNSIWLRGQTESEIEYPIRSGMVIVSPFVDVVTVYQAEEASYKF